MLWLFLRVALLFDEFNWKCKCMSRYFGWHCITLCLSLYFCYQIALAFIYFCSSAVSLAKSAIWFDFCTWIVRQKAQSSALSLQWFFVGDNSIRCIWKLLWNMRQPALTDTLCAAGARFISQTKKYQPKIEWNWIFTCDSVRLWSRTTLTRFAKRERGARKFY